MRKILLDTNFLMIPGQFGVDIFAEIDRICEFEYELVIMEESGNELEHIRATQPRKDAQNASLALQLVKAKHINGIHSPVAESDVDDQIVATLEQNPQDYVLATSDKYLRERALKLGVPCIVMRGKKKLEMIQ